MNKPDVTKELLNKICGRIIAALIGMQLMSYVIVSFYGVSLPWWLILGLCLLWPWYAYSMSVITWALKAYGHLHAPFILPHS